jgi:hypothetical protein
VFVFAQEKVQHVFKKCFYFIVNFLNKNLARLKLR